MQQDDGTRQESAEPPARRGRNKRWTRWIGAGAIALALGAGQAYADTIVNNHEGGQGRDKSASASATAEAHDGGARASSSGGASASGKKTGSADATASASAIVDGVEDGAGGWTRTTTQTYSSTRAVISVTRSISYAADEDGNMAKATAYATATAPNSAKAVRGGAGFVIAKTSVAVTGNGVASADAGGSIGISRGAVTASTWGKTSAEVF